MINEQEKLINAAVNKLQRGLPGAQRRALEELLLMLKKLDLSSDGKIKTTVENLRITNKVRGKLNEIILNDAYLNDVSEFVTVFDDVERLQTKYWKTLDDKFKPSSVMREVKKQAVSDVVKNLTEGGIGVNITADVEGILRTNITSGGSYFKLEQQLRDKLMNNRTGQGALERYARQITTDAVNQYAAQITQLTSADMGVEWFEIQGGELDTSRPICQAMLEGVKFFHVSQVPNLLRGLDAAGERLTYKDNDGTHTVDIYAKTKLPSGMIEGTNSANYFINRNGYNCGHQFRPVLREKTVPEQYKKTVYNSPAYIAWKVANK